MVAIQVIVILRPEKNEGSDFDNIPIKVTCKSWDELEKAVEEFIKGYNQLKPDGQPIFDWHVAHDADILASMMVQEHDDQ